MSKLGRMPVSPELYEKQARDHEKQIAKLEKSIKALEATEENHADAISLINRQLSFHISRAIGCRKMKARLLEGRGSL